MKKLVIEFSNERLITPSGLSLVGQLLGKSNFIKKCNNMKVDGKRSQSQIKNGDILLSYIGLLCQGKTSYDSINEMKILSMCISDGLEKRLNQMIRHLNI